MFGISLNRIRTQVRRWRGSVHLSQGQIMDEENLNSPPAINSASCTDATQHQSLDLSENAARGSTAVTCSTTPRPSEFLSSTIRATSTNEVARSSLAFYVDCMHKIGICPHVESQVVKAGAWQKFHKICYLGIVVLTIFHVIRNVKFEAMAFLGQKEDIGRMMIAISAAVYGINTMYLMYFLSFKWEPMVETLRSLNHGDSMYLGSTRKQINEENKRIGRAVFAFSVVLVVILLVSYFHRYDEWSIRDFVGFESFYTRATFTVWRPKYWHNGTAGLWEDYGEDLSPISITLSVLGGICRCFGWLHEHLLLDIVLLLSLGVSGHMSRLIGIIQDESASLDAKWEEYEKMRKWSGKINVAFQYFLPLAHINNLFLFSYFLLGGFLKIRFVYIMLIGAKVVKILLSYGVASATANKNKLIQNWILVTCEEGDPVIIKGKRVPVPVLLKIAYNDLIGLGLDDFFISMKSLLMFIGTVGTIFLLLVDSNKEDKKDCTCIST